MSTTTDYTIIRTGDTYLHSKTAVVYDIEISEIKSNRSKARQSIVIL